MKTIYSFLIILSVVMISCNEEHNGDFNMNAKEFIKLKSSVNSIPVGVKSAVKITASMTNDAEGEICTFSSTTGGFKSYEEKSETIDVVVDVNGEAVAYWFPSNDPVLSNLSATVKTVRADLEISVTPVEAIDFDNDFSVPYSIDSTFMLSVVVDPIWKGLPIDIGVSSGILQVQGVAKDGFNMGSKVVPVLDQTGKVQMTYTTPSANETVVFTATLFGTAFSQAVFIEE